MTDAAAVGRVDVARLREKIEALIALWLSEAAAWRADDETPYACEWADTQEECANQLNEALTKALVPAPSTMTDEKD